MKIKVESHTRRAVQARLELKVKRSDSVTQILLQLGLPSFNILIHNSRIIFLRTWTNCPNMLVSHLRQLGLCFQCTVS